MPEYITREEHEAVISRIDAEDSRQNHRLDKLEATVENIATLTIAVEQLAVCDMIVKIMNGDRIAVLRVHLHQMLIDRFLRQLGAPGLLREKLHPRHLLRRRAFRFCHHM